LSSNRPSTARATGKSPISCTIRSGKTGTGSRITGKQAAENLMDPHKNTANMEKMGILNIFLQFKQMSHNPHLVAFETRQLKPDKPHRFTLFTFFSEIILTQTYKTCII
jgi:hypothetical protein